MTAVGVPSSQRVGGSARKPRRTSVRTFGRTAGQHPRDVALALAAGASQVMAGSRFAAPTRGRGDHRGRGRPAPATVFGTASACAVKHRTLGRGPGSPGPQGAVRGRGIPTPPRTLDPQRPGWRNLLDHMTSGVRSSMTYAGATTLRQFASRAWWASSPVGLRRGQATLRVLVLIRPFSITPPA
ncbi:IMP dehydrogenase [Kocuria rhizophila]|nr:IMP dehydrogenase [Kocuria rhizophila]